jgi:uncharacterized protein YndB with AHSA1/START domain
MEKQMTNEHDQPTPLDTPLFIQVTQRLPFSAGRGFDAWLEPAMLRRWIFNTSEQIVRLEVDARVGGGFSFVVNRQGTEVDHIGVYREINRPSRLVFTWGVKGHSNPDDSLVTIELLPSGDGCELTLTQKIDPKWAEYKERTRASWERILARLAEAGDLFPNQSA